MCQSLTACSVTLPIAPQSVRTARAHLREWLEFLDWPQPGGYDLLLLAVNEAVSNAVEHSGDVADSIGPIEQVVDIIAAVEVTATTRQLRIRVRDHGRWREPPTDPGHRGYGMRLMFELAEQVSIHRGPIGTEITLLSTTVDPLDATP